MNVPVFFILAISIRLLIPVVLLVLAGYFVERRQAILH